MLVKYLLSRFSTFKNKLKSYKYDLLKTQILFTIIPNKLKILIKSLYALDDSYGNNVLFVTLNDKVF